MVNRPSQETDMPMNRWLRVIVIAMLVGLALFTRLPAPWRVEVINDEMFHIKSWRNRYRTDDVMPLFLRRLDQTSAFNSRQKATLRELYHTSPLFQRLLCVKGDYASVGYSAFAEAIEAASKSSLVALRLPSVVFSLGTIVLAYLLGRALMDQALGLWLAAFFTIGPLTQVYAGIGRPHGMTQFALVAVVYAFVLEQRQQRASPWRFLAVALFAQAGHLTGWGIVGLLVASELLRRYLAGTSIPRLARQVWWYAAISVVMLGLIVVGSIGTSVISANVYYPGAKTWWGNLCLASPFGHLAHFGEPGMWASGALWAALILNGVRMLFDNRANLRGFRGPFLVVLAASLSIPFYASSGVRHMMIYGVMPMVLSAIGARCLFGSPRAALVGVLALLAVFAPLSLLCKECPYKFILPNDARYSEVASLLAREMRPGDVWISWPYFLGCPLYPYASLPEPIMPVTGNELRAALRDRPTDHACFVLIVKVDEGIDPVLGRPEFRIEYPNDMVLLKLPPRGPEAEQ